MMPRAIMVAAVFSLLISGCSVRESITSFPMGADIYWGKSPENLMSAGVLTPSRRDVSGQKLESWCYQVRKEGYDDSVVVCREASVGDRNIHFDLQPVH